MKKTSILSRIRNWVSKHKAWSIIIIIIVLIGGYLLYRKSSPASAATQYVLSPVQIGTITQTITGSGQVSAENQLDITSEVSAKVQAINVSIGQHVKKGDLLATLESSDAAISLESARIAYAKLVKPAKPGDVTDAQNSVTKSYSDGYNAAASLYIDLPNIMAGAKDMFYDVNGFLSDQKTSYLISTARTYRETAAASYDKAANLYKTSLEEYKSVNRSSATSSISAFVSHSYDLVKTVAAMLQNTQNTLTFISATQPDYHPDDLSAAVASVNTWSGQINSDLSSIVSSRNSIASTENSLRTLIEGAEDLDIQSQRLSLRQAEENYAKYFIRAPFDGTIGRIPVSVYSQAGASTVIATIIGDRKIANISLNEVDAAKVKAGQQVKIEFDAIDGLHATGTVDRVDLVGTVSQGVVSYTVRVAIDTIDDRIKPGMSMNVSIITKEKSGVLTVPSSAVKSQGNRKYVEIIKTPTAGSSNSPSTRTVTATSGTAPSIVMVTVGEADDVNTEITGGLERGQMVVTRTISASGSTATTPNIFTSIGGNRAGGSARPVIRQGN